MTDAASLAEMVAQGRAATSSSTTAMGITVIRATNVVMGTGKDVSVVGAKTAAMGMTTSTAETDPAIFKMTGVLTIQA